MSYDVTRPNVKNYETTAIDSGTIWTTEVYRERSSTHRDVDPTYGPLRPTKLNRNYDVDMLRNNNRSREQLNNKVKFIYLQRSNTNIISGYL